MSPIELNRALFLIAILAFAWVGFRASRAAASVNEYFHDKSLRKNIVSLTATNITLGTGLVYLVSGAQANGLLMILPVICVAIGYWLLGVFVARVGRHVNSSERNFLYSLEERIEHDTGRSSQFAFVVSGCTVLVFVLVLAFEIFASTKVLAPLLFDQADLRAEIAVSIVVFVITVLYTLLGGIRAVFGVDVIQVPLIVLFLAVFGTTIFADVGSVNTIGSRLAGSFKFDFTVVLGIAIACVNALATQFYSIVNWGAVSNVNASDQARMLKWVGILTAAVLLLFVVGGLLYPPGAKGQVWNELMAVFTDFDRRPGIISYVVMGAVVLGMASILLTTTDAVVVTCVLFCYDNLLGGDSKNPKRDSGAIWKIRLIGASAFSLSFAALLLLNYFQPDPFYLLLSMAGGIVVFAPLILGAGLMALRPGGLRVLTPGAVYLFLGIFLASAVADVVLLGMKSPLVSAVGLISFLLSFAICTWLLIRSRSSASL